MKNDSPPDDASSAALRKGPAPPDDGRLKHSAVQYDHGMKGSRCLLCRYYVGVDVCLLVEDVTEAGWCELFTKVREEKS